MDLKKAFEMQKAMRERLVKERGLEFTDEQWMLNFLVAIEDEIGEVRDELNWKWWKNPKVVDISATRNEIVDIWIFLIELTISSGMSLPELEERFDAKTAENHARQDGTSSKPGYAVSADVSRPSAADKLYATNDVSITQRIANQLSSVNPLHGSIQSGRRK